MALLRHFEPLKRGYLRASTVIVDGRAPVIGGQVAGDLPVKQAPYPPYRGQKSRAASIRPGSGAGFPLYGFREWGGRGRGRAILAAYKQLPWPELHAYTREIQTGGRGWRARPSTSTTPAGGLALGGGSADRPG